MKRIKNKFIISLSLLTAFILWTVAICFVDVQAIGPCGSFVGFAKINNFVHNLTGVHFGLYNITDWLGLVPIGIAFYFAVLGLVQWIKRRKLVKVDRSLLTLGGFYIVVMAVYIFFETVVINYRPVLIGGYLEVSYPSSTTLLVMCVMPTAMMQLGTRIKNKIFRRCVLLIIALFITFMVIGRLVSGVHWVTDIIGGALISSALVMMYAYVCNNGYS